MHFFICCIPPFLSDSIIYVCLTSLIYMFQTNTTCSARLVVTVNRNIQLDCWMSAYMWYSFLATASKLLNLKHDRGAATRQSSRVHWCEHLSPM